MKRIKYFIASAGKLSEERDRIEIYLNRKNDQLITDGFYIEPVIWEKLSASFHPDRIQDRFNKELLECDVMICLVFDKVGKYTYEELTTAYKNFKNGKNPKKIYVYFKDASIKSSEINSDFNSVLSLKEEIEKIEQYPISYSNVDKLLLDIERNFQIDYKEFRKQNLNEQLTAFLNKINPEILNLLGQGFNEVHVFIVQENKFSNSKLIEKLEEKRIIKLIDRAHTMLGFGELPIGTIADKNQSGSSRSRLFTIKVLENFNNYH